MSINLYIVAGLSTVAIGPIAFLFWDKSRADKNNGKVKMLLEAEKVSEIEVDKPEPDKKKSLSDNGDTASHIAFVRSVTGRGLFKAKAVYNKIYPASKYSQIYRKWDNKNRDALIALHDAIFQQLYQDQLVPDFEESFDTIYEVALAALEKPSQLSFYLPPYDLSDMASVKHRMAAIFLNYANLHYSEALDLSSKIVNDRSIIYSDKAIRAETVEEKAD